MRTLSTLVFILCAGLSSGAARAGEPREIARVGDVSVTQYDVERELARLLPMQQEAFHGSLSPERLAALREKAADSAIERALKAAGAPAVGVTVDEAAVEAELKKVTGKFRDQAELTKALAGEPLDAFRAYLARVLLAQRAEERAVESLSAVPPEEVRRWYDANREKYQTERMYKVSEIRLAVDPAGTDAERDAAFQKARDLQARARAGADFYDLAYYNSTERTKFVGGDLGWLRTGQNQPEFDAAMIALKPGEVSEVVHTIFGFHVLRLAEIQEPRVMTYDELRTTIEDILKKQRRQKAYDTWMADLRKKHPVVRHGP